MVLEAVPKKLTSFFVAMPLFVGAMVGRRKTAQTEPAAKGKKGKAAAPAES